VRLTFGGTRTKSAAEGKERALAAKERILAGERDPTETKGESRGACADREE
jgi:hypothetical protein